MYICEWVCVKSDAAAWQQSCISASVLKVMQLHGNEVV